MQKADHSGHRSRMKKKLLEQGLDAFEPHEVLEILLYYAIPQRNTNDIAKNLINRFGSLSAVFDASIDSLKDAGLTEHQAILVNMIPSVTRLYMLDKYHNPQKRVDYAKMSEYVINRFIGYEKVEHVFLLLMNKQGKEVYSGMIAHGDFDGADFSIRDIVSLAINHGATTAVLAHNHPSGIAIPSRADVQATLDAQKALRLVNVTLLDHFVVAGGKCESMMEAGLI